MSVEMNGTIEDYRTMVARGRLIVAAEGVIQKRDARLLRAAASFLKWHPLSEYRGHGECGWCEEIRGHGECGWCEEIHGVDRGVECSGCPIRFRGKGCGEDGHPWCSWGFSTHGSTREKTYADRVYALVRRAYIAELVARGLVPAGTE